MQSALIDEKHQVRHGKSPVGLLVNLVRGSALIVLFSLHVFDQEASW